MGLSNFLRNLSAMWNADAPTSESVARVDAIQLRRNYRAGSHTPQLKVKPEGGNDNVYVNLVKLVTSRSVSLLVGKGVDWKLPSEDGAENPAADYLAETWKLNRRSVVMHNAVQNASDAGCGFLKLIPNALERDGVFYPRIVAIDPQIVTEIKTLPNDKDTLTGYVLMYATQADGGEQQGHKQEIERRAGAPDEAGRVVYSWETVDYVEQKGKWVEVGRETFADANGNPYPFPPLVHWQNLPDAVNAWGEPDVTNDGIMLQDRINFAYSNIGKILKQFGHPHRYGKMLGQETDITTADGNMRNYNDPAASIEQVPPVGDLPGAVIYAATLVRAMFDTTRTVDLGSLADKLGSLTNFALRVLFFDALQKLETKRELFGEAILETNRRILAIGEQAETDPGEIVWPRNVLPVDDLAEVQTIQAEIDAGLMSKAEGIIARGRDPQKVEEAIAKDKQANQDADLGTLLLRMRGFNQTGTGQAGTGQ